MIRVELSRPNDLAALEVKWRALEPHMDGSFFTSWTWIGCMAETRFPDPVLLEAFDGMRPVGLALFNRKRGRLHLSETGDPVLDGLTVEHNGIMSAPDCGDAVRAACLTAARRVARAVVLSGVASADRRAATATGPVEVRRVSAAPFVDLVAVRTSGRSYLQSLSANTRYQVRRSERRYAKAGPVTADRAPDLPSAHAYLDALIGLHATRWAAKGGPGAFSHPTVRRFHHLLLDRGFHRGEIDLWRVAAGRVDVGYLYNLKYREHVMSYQSGLLFEPGSHLKPGLTCHCQAIQSYQDEGLRMYDFLAGQDRYKLSLSTDQSDLHWLVLADRGSSAWFFSKLRSLIGYLK